METSRLVDGLYECGYGLPNAVYGRIGDGHTGGLEEPTGLGDGMRRAVPSSLLPCVETNTSFQSSFLLPHQFPSLLRGPLSLLDLSEAADTETQANMTLSTSPIGQLAPPVLSMDACKTIFIFHS
jgi:hypothetical protein